MTPLPTPTFRALFVLPSTPLSTPTPTPKPTPTPPPIYVVKSGDTGLAIAISFNVTLVQLAEANGMTEKDLDTLHIGQELKIPR